jgi:hypothetical protein
MDNDTRLSLSDARGPIVDLLEKLDGRDGEGWLRGLNKFLRKENPWEKPEGFLEIEVGAYQSVKTLEKALEDADVRVSSWADDILGKTKLSRSRKTLELAVMSVKELGFPNGARYDQICEAADNFGLELCPAEVGAYLCLLLPVGEVVSYVVAMEAIKDSGGAPGVFFVECDGDGRWLRASIGFPDILWSARCRFVFVRRK